MKIILASQSPRRKELLSNLGLEFVQVKSEIAEQIDSSLKPCTNAMALAFEKAFVVAEQYPDRIVIAADTIVYYKSEILEKPTDEQEAYTMLKKLNGKKHSVITGFAIINIEKNVKIVDFEETVVEFNNNTDEKIKKYIATGEPMDKAGAYGIQDKGALLVKGIEGDYFNIVGLPLTKVNTNLEKYLDVSLM